MSEHKLQEQIVKLLRDNDILVFETDVMDGLKFFSHKDYRRYAFIKHHNKMGYIKGQPDLVVITDNEVTFVEVKTESGVLSKEQKEFASKVESLNHNALVWRSLEQVREFINFFKKTY